MAEGILGIFNLPAEIQNYVPGEGESGRRAEILVKTDRLRVVLVTMRSDAALQEHAVPGPITIHVLRGQFVVHVGEDDIKIVEGGLVSIDADVRHSVVALEDGAFLLTIGYPGDAPEEATTAS